VIGSGDGDGIDIGLIEEFAVIVVTARNFKAFTGFPGALNMGLGDRDSGGARESGETQEMANADCTRSYYTASKLVRHIGVRVVPMFSMQGTKLEGFLATGFAKYCSRMTYGSKIVLASLP